MFKEIIYANDKAYQLIRVIDLKLMRSYDLVVQLVRISACHAEGREFESRPDRKRENSSVGRASVFQAEGREFESHFSLKCLVK